MNKMCAFSPFFHSLMIKFVLMSGNPSKKRSKNCKETEEFKKRSEEPKVGHGVIVFWSYACIMHLHWIFVSRSVIAK